MPKEKERNTRLIIKSFEAKELKKRSFSTRIADNLASFFGSILFLILNLSIFIFWILANQGKIPGVPIFDPYPYVLLITTVSLEAIVLTTIVLMSQARESQISSLRDELQLQVNLIAEKEITKILQLLTELLKKKGVEIKDQELEDMLREVDTSYIERKLVEQLSEKPVPIIQEVTKPILEAGKKVEESFSIKK